MLKNIRRLSAPLLLAVAAHAQESFGPGAPENRNHIFFHPTLTLFSLAIDEVPTFLAVTYERDLEGAKSLIWQPQFIFGSAIGEEATDTQGEIEVSQLTFANYLGLRKYFRGTPGGFYIQGSGAFLVGSVGAEQEGSTEKADGVVTAYGALAYLGYKWTHVFFDIGGGYQAASGTLEFSDGREVEASVTGPTLDINLGFGF